jgi:hypothetical protein
MDIQRMLHMLIWLAILGAVVYFGSRIAGRAASNVKA